MYVIKPRSSTKLCTKRISPCILSNGLLFCITHIPNYFFNLVYISEKSFSLGLLNSEIVLFISKRPAHHIKITLGQKAQMSKCSAYEFLEPGFIVQTKMQVTKTDDKTNKVR